MESGALEKKDLEAWYNRTHIEEIREIYSHPDIGEIVAKKKKGIVKDIRLPMTEPPISCTAVKISNFVFFDPSLDEEELADARLTVATDQTGDIRAMQKGLAGSFSKEEIQNVIQGALENGRRIREHTLRVHLRSSLSFILFFFFLVRSDGDVSWACFS